MACSSTGAPTTRQRRSTHLLPPSATSTKARMVSTTAAFASCSITPHSTPANTRLPASARPSPHTTTSHSTSTLAVPSTYRTSCATVRTSISTTNSHATAQTPPAPASCQRLPSATEYCPQGTSPSARRRLLCCSTTRCLTLLEAASTTTRCLSSAIRIKTRCKRGSIKRLAAKTSYGVCSPSKADAATTPTCSASSIRQTRSASPPTSTGPIASPATSSSTLALTSAVRGRPPRPTSRTLRTSKARPASSATIRTQRNGDRLRCSSRAVSPA
jgi:hypothetical protein